MTDNWVFILVVSLSVIVGFLLIVVSSALIYHFFFRNRKSTRHFRQRSLVDTFSASTSSISGRSSGRHLATKQNLEAVRKGHFTYPVTRIHHSQGWSSDVNQCTPVNKYKAKDKAKSRQLTSSAPRRHRQRHLKLRMSSRGVRPRAYTQSLDRRGVTNIHLTPEGQVQMSDWAAGSYIIRNDESAKGSAILASGTLSSENRIHQSEQILPDTTGMCSSLTTDGAPNVCGVSTLTSEHKGSVLW